ncbi:beta-lactamase/transpeptidase-like protein [Pestalotiopsis sp. NC0098]|nr:beta-lactamase/transpeptidase-like protein [Pestalotiopsis sp. NC0098]
MKWTSKSSLALLAGALPLSAAINNCPLDGPVFPKPTKLSTLPVIKEAVANLTGYFEQWNANYSATGNFSYSVQIFSAHEQDALFSYSHTAAKLAKINHPGVATVDENSVFRLGSLTKVFTVYNMLLNAGDEIWNSPITKYIPELAAMAANASSSSNPVANIAWQDVTIGSLATQMSGIPRDYALLGEVSQQDSTKARVVQLGFPPLPEADLPPCGDTPLCTRAQFFAGMSKFAPSVGTFQTPTYSDIGFQLLGYALEEITGKDYQSLLQDTVLTPLGLNGTFYQRPDNALGVIPGNANLTQWNFQLGDEAPAGNMYSTAADLSKLGRAILNYKQLSPVVTKRWLKPFAFSSDPKASVGAPWGVRRIPLGPEYRETTGYNKAGGIGSYMAAFILIPDYDVGFSIMIAGDIPGNTNWDIADILGNTFVPAVTAAAKNQAATKFNGVYAAPANVTNGGKFNRPLNSSITIATDAKPGLSVSSWISNGTDFRNNVVALQLTYQPTTPSIRLYPGGLVTDLASGGKEVKFKAIFEDLAVAQQVDKMFSTDCGSWVGVESVLYASTSADDLIFNQDAAGNVQSITIPSLRITMPKVS